MTTPPRGALTLDMMRHALDDRHSWPTAAPMLMMSMGTLRGAGVLGRVEIHNALDTMARQAGRTFLGAAIIPHPDLEAAGRWILGGGTWPYIRPRFHIGEPLHERYISDPPRIEAGTTWNDIERSDVNFWNAIFPL